MRPRDRELAKHLDECLLSFDREARALPAIKNPEMRSVLVEQLLASVHRVKYVLVIRERNISDHRADPNDERFYPLKAAILSQRNGQIDEAFWLVFLLVHFGKHARAGCRYVREVYGRLGESAPWDWANTSAHPSSFRRWLDAHQEDLRRGGTPRGFGNHRKYQSLDAYTPTGTGAAVETYVRWVNPPRTHGELMEQACQTAEDDPRQAFDDLYGSMNAVKSFGRMARFDYLTMVGKLGLAHIEPGSTYMGSSTGPLKGARLLFSGKKTTALNPAELDEWLGDLDAQLNVGMQVLEDALCNWQKSPTTFKPFRG